MITVEDLSNLGPALKELRQNVRMTQGEVCALAGLKSSQLSRWENGHEKPTLESVVKVLAALGRDLGDLQAILAGNYLDKMMDGDAGPRLDREHGEKVRAAYLEALRARRAVARLAAEGVYPFEGGYPEADRVERAALHKLLTAASGQFIDSKEGYFARLSVEELWAHFRILERRFGSWVTADTGEPPDTLAVRWGEERWGSAEVERSRRGGERVGDSQAELLRALERRLRSVEERLEEVEDSV